MSEGGSPAPVAPTVRRVPEAGAGGVDELYEQLVDRLRRDLLAERERMGDLLGDV